MPTFSFGSLRIRLLLLVLLAVIPALALTFYTNMELRRRAAADMEAEALRLARIAASDQDNSIKATRQFLYALTQLPQLYSGEPADCSAFFARLLNQYPQYTMLGAIGLDGNLFCSAIPSDSSINLVDQDYFQRALRTHDFAIGAYQRDPLSGQATLSFAYPVLNEASQVQSIVFATLDLAWLNELAAKAALPEGSTFTVIDRYGTVLVRYPDPGTWVGQSVPEATIIQTILSQKGEGTAAASGVDGVRRLFAFTPLAGEDDHNDVYVAIGIPHQVAFAAANQVLARHLIGLGLVAVLALAAAWVGSDLVILRWVDGLLRAARRLHAGDLSARTGLPDRSDELGQLGRAFDQMAESLEQRVAELDRTEAALRESQRTLATLMTNLPGMAYRCHNDRDRTMQFVSEGCLELTGYAPADLIESKRVSYAQLIHPEDREPVWNEMQAALRGGAPFRLTYRILTAAREEKWVWEQGRSILAHEGDLPALEGFIADITERMATYQLLERRVADRTRELQALYDVMAVASQSLDLKIVLERSLERLLAVMGSQLGAIHLLDESGQSLHLAASQGIPSEDIAHISSVAVDEGLVGLVVEDGRPLVLPEIVSGPRPLIAIPAVESQAYLGVPICVKGKVMGVLSVVGEAGRQFTRDEVALLDSIADQVGVAVENARLYQQAGQLAVVEERSRLARDLHDSVTQALYSMTLLAEAGGRLIRAGNLDRAEMHLARLSEAARQALKEMRLMIYDLRPPALEQAGLAGALGQRLEAVEGRAGVETRLLVDGQPDLPTAVEEGLYRIAQEALNNALKHSGASLVTVRLRAADGRVTLEVADNGIGFDPAVVSGGMGLTNMRERAERLGGRLNIESRVGQGTRVEVELNSGEIP